jgi:hypothetical protein
MCMSVLDFSVVVKCVRLLTEWLCVYVCARFECGGEVCQVTYRMVMCVCLC